MEGKSVDAQKTNSANSILAVMSKVNIFDRLKFEKKSQKLDCERWEICHLVGKIEV